jgi:hypothetical protein
MLEALTSPTKNINNKFYSNIHVILTLCKIVLALSYGIIALHKAPPEVCILLFQMDGLGSR